MSQLTELQSDNIAQLMETSRRQLNPERQFTSPTLKCPLPLLLERRLCGGYGVAMPVNELMVTRVTLGRHARPDAPRHRQEAEADRLL